MFVFIVQIFLTFMKIYLHDIINVNLISEKRRNKKGLLNQARARKKIHFHRKS